MIMDYLELRYLNISVFRFDPLNLSHCHLIVKLRNPAEANIKCTLFLKLVQSRIQSFLFHEDHLVNLEDGNT
jgi:hypothetical protein